MKKKTSKLLGDTSVLKLQKNRFLYYIKIFLMS